MEYEIIEIDKWKAKVFYDKNSGLYTIMTHNTRGGAVVSGFNKEEEIEKWRDRNAQRFKTL